MASTQIVLDKRNKKKNGTFPIKMRISSHNKWVAISTGFSVEEKHWDALKRLVKRSESCHLIINTELARYMSAAMQVLSELNRSSFFVNPNEIKRLILVRLKPGYQKGDFISYSKEQIDLQRKYGKIGTANWYSTCISVLQNFYGPGSISFNDFDVTTVRSFDYWMSGNNRSVNTRSNYHRGLRALFNRALAEDYVSGIQNPYEKFKIKSASTKKRAIGIDQLKAIKEIDLEQYPLLKLHRDIFLFSFYTRGTNYRDIICLKRSNIQEGKISYLRAKTHKEYVIKLTEDAREIVEYYSSKQKGQDPFLFPVLTGKRLGGAEQKHKTCKQAMKVHNTCLKEVADLAQLEINLTSYVARHSWATLAKRNNISSLIIRDAMGHKSVSTTESYLQSLDNDELDDINDELTRLN